MVSQMLIQQTVLLKLSILPKMTKTSASNNFLNGKYLKPVPQNWVHMSKVIAGFIKIEWPWRVLPIYIISFIWIFKKTIDPGKTWQCLSFRIQRSKLWFLGISLTFWVRRGNGVDDRFPELDSALYILTSKCLQVEFSSSVRWVI